uniref:NADH dehydrogenase subunit 6 n=2 Tax=Elaphe TaxID=8579 RepID=A0A3G0ZGD3_9SAUR|nr:NADH dehydrogenase subunit 6 [Elaphe bimaculata]YP_009560206.1 NADH dehydrogenase subunit 6 [Elaphe dione]AIJ02062.1 NADH dehydrogenase subunit 6 [Elaphe bimaculata]QAA79052.1 NADH dehydrogenase subunit 6 [Elaphe dione]
MNYFIGLIMVFLVLSVFVLSVVSVPYQGVIALMGVSFFCCIFMVALGRTFSALLMYIVYLGGLVVVFGYCVSVEKDSVVFKVVGVKYFVIFMFVLFSILYLFGGVDGLLVYTNWEDLVCLEVNGGSVFYFSGGAGLIVCSWGLLVVLFSILVILSWSRLGGLRPF